MLTDKTLQSVAEAVKKVMEEELKGNQKALDKNNNNRLDSQDFKILRGEKKAVKKEEVEQVEEGWDDMMKAVKEKKGPQPSGGSGKKEGTRYGGSKQKDEKEKMKEEVEQIDELSKSTLASYAKKATHDARLRFAQGKDFERISKSSRKPEYKAGAKEWEDKYKSDARKREAGVNKAIDRLAKEEVEQIEERQMTEPEMKKREEIVKSMKKGIQGFKARYGDRAKNVMYATATKQAMKEETESEHYKAGHEYGSDHAMDSGFKVTARARKKEMLADNPHKKGTKEHDDWHRGASDGHEMALNNM